MTTPRLAQAAETAATWAASEEAKAVSAAIDTHCAEALERDLVEADFKEFETRVAATLDVPTIQEWQRKLENALGVPHDLMERGRDVMAAQMRTIQKHMALGLEPVMGKMREDEATRCREMIKEMAAKLALHTPSPSVQMLGGKLNKSRSWEKNQKLGHHAERMASRWPTWHRRYKKWMRVAARCGVSVWCRTTFYPIRPAEYLTIDFDIVPAGVVFK